MSTKRNEDGLSAALFGRTRRAVLGVLFSHPDESFYLRQLTRSAGLGLGAAQRELKRLVEAGIATRTARGRETYYRADPRCPISRELRGLIAKTGGLADVVRIALSPLADRIAVAFIYGSQAAGRATARSDVDLLVVGEVDELDLHRAAAKAEQELGRTVNYTLMVPDEFARRRGRRDAFLGRILAGEKIAILGNVDDV